MKNGTIVLVTFAMALAGCGASTSSTENGPATSRQEKNEAEFEKFASLIESGSYQYTVRTATPTGGKTMQITSVYTLEAKDGVYEAHLPFFGRAYSASYGGGNGGIDFKGEPENLTLSRNEKRSAILVSFDIMGDNDQYNISLEIGSSGYGSLRINSRKRASISYYGQVTELKP